MMGVQLARSCARSADRDELNLPRHDQTEFVSSDPLNILVTLEEIDLGSQALVLRFHNRQPGPQRGDLPLGVEQLNAPAGE
jgi:hypothetical protein